MHRIKRYSPHKSETEKERDQLQGVNANVKVKAKASEGYAISPNIKDKLKNNIKATTTEKQGWKWATGMGREKAE